VRFVAAGALTAGLGLSLIPSVAGAETSGATGTEPPRSESTESEKSWGSEKSKSDWEKSEKAKAEKAEAEKAKAKSDKAKSEKAKSEKANSEKAKSDKAKSEKAKADEAKAAKLVAPWDQARCAAAIDGRLAELAKLNSRLQDSKHTTEAHKAAQIASNTAASVGLSELAVKIAADTDPAVLAADCKAIFEDYRVYALRAPQTNLVIAGDAATAAVAKLTGILPELSVAMAAAAGEGKDMTEANAAFADLQAKLVDAASKANGLADSVIGLTPADYNADHGVLDLARAAARAAALDLKAARKDVKTILAAVRG
jgi:hypothetical protein